VDAPNWRIEVEVEGGLTPHLKDFLATLLAFGETEVNHDASMFSLRVIRQSFERGVFRIKSRALLLQSLKSLPKM
jgi:hypothetical protein